MEERPALGRHLLVAAAVALAAILIAAFWLGGKERRLAATNSIAPADTAAEVAPGESLCVARLWLPADANAVRLRMASSGRRRARVVLRLDEPGRASSSTARAVPGAADVDFAVRPLHRDAPVRLCLRPDRRIRVEGMRDREVSGVGYEWRRFQADQPSPVELDGRAVPARVSVWFLKPESRTLAATLPDVLRRASIFRPGFVGSWTYLVMLAVLVVLWLVGLRLLWGGRGR